MPVPGSKNATRSEGTRGAFDGFSDAQIGAARQMLPAIAASISESEGVRLRPVTPPPT